MPNTEWLDSIAHQLETNVDPLLVASLVRGMSEHLKREAEGRDNG